MGGFVKHFKKVDLLQLLIGKLLSCTLWLLRSQDKLATKKFSKVDFVQLNCSTNPPYMNFSFGTTYYTRCRISLCLGDANSPVDWNMGNIISFQGNFETGPNIMKCKSSIEDDIKLGTHTVEIKYRNKSCSFDWTHIIDQWSKHGLWISLIG